MEKECNDRIEKIMRGFQNCREALTAIGDETRQLILLTLLQSDLSGIRVGELAQKTHLTRPSVSHHLGILKEARIVRMRKEGTKNYYYINCEDGIWDAFSVLMTYIKDSVHNISDGGKNDTVFFRNR